MLLSCIGALPLEHFALRQIKDHGHADIMVPSIGIVETM